MTMSIYFQTDAETVKMIKKLKMNTIHVIKYKLKNFYHKNENIL